MFKTCQLFAIFDYQGCAFYVAMHFTQHYNIHNIDQKRLESCLYLLFGVMHLKKPNFHCYLNVYCNVGEKYGILCLLSLCEISMRCEFQFGIFLVVMLLN